MANRILISQSKIDNDGEHLYMYPSSSILMSDNVSNVEEAINNKPGKKIEGGGELFNDAGNASGNNSHAEGYGSSATGNAAHAEGYSSLATGAYSHAEGAGTIATVDCQHVQGKYNIEDTEELYAHIIGWGDKGTGAVIRKNIHTVSTSGDGWFAGKVSAGTIETPANPVNPNDLITKKYLDDTIISVGEGGVGSRTEEGGEIFNSAIGAGSNSHAEGTSTSAPGISSHAEGSYTEAASGNQHVQGQYNIVDSEGVYAHIVGWGTSDSSRANIHTINTIGDGWFAGTVKGEAGLGFSDFSMEQINSATSGADQTYRAVLKHSGNSVSSIDHAGNGWFAGAVEADNGIKIGGATLKYDEELQTVVFQFNE